jgi:hypothetical protein
MVVGTKEMPSSIRGTAFGTLAVQSTVSLTGRFVIVVLITPTKRDSILYNILFRTFPLPI